MGGNALPVKWALHGGGGAAGIGGGGGGRRKEFLARIRSASCTKRLLKCQSRFICKAGQQTSRKEESYLNHPSSWVTLLFWLTMTRDGTHRNREARNKT